MEQSSKRNRQQRPSAFHEKEAELLSTPHDKEFEQRKLELWRRVKAAMNRWAQLRRMTKYGMLWLGDEEEKREGVDEFKEKNGYDFEFVIVFPLVENDDDIDDCTNLLETKQATAEILKALEDCGVETKTFPSVQDDELFCLVRIPPNVLAAFSEANNIELELNPEKLEKVVTSGSARHEISAQEIPHDEARCMYKPYEHIFAPYHRKIHDYFKVGVGIDHPFDRLIRLKLIPWIIQSDVEIDKTVQGGAGLKLKELKDQGKINDFYPLHDEAMRQAVYNNWILRSTWPWALPVSLIRAYFGEKVALFFSFAAHYTSWFLPLALLGFVAQMQVFQNGYDKSPLLLIFSATVSVWPIFMLESWKRKEATHVAEWGMAHFTVSEAERPEFFGDTRPSLVDGTPETFYPDWKRRRKVATSVFATSLFICVNLAIQVLVFSIRTYVSNNASGEYQSILITSSSIVISFQISVADVLYQFMAISLTEAENHVFASEYYDSLIVKFAIFQLFNNYSSFFYVGFVKPFFGITCQSLFGNTNPCMQELGYLLGVVFISDMMSNMVIQVVVPRLKGKWRQYSEGLSSEPTTDFRSDVSSVAEQEATLEHYDVILDLLMDYKTINIQFGYLTFFVGALPILPVIAFGANVVEMRVDGHKLLREHRCPATSGASNIGMWQSVFISYGMAAVVSNSAIIFFSTDLVGAGDINTASKVWFFFIFQYSVYAGMFLIAILVEDIPESVSIQLARQDFYVNKVMSKLITGGSDVLERFRDAALKLSKDMDGNGGIQKVFSLLSIDGISITSHSLKLGLNLIGFKTTDLDMKILMNRLDADKSGVLDLDEFKSFVQSTTDNDVRLVCRRLRKKLASRLEEVSMIFNKHDKDGSGSIDILEMRSVLMDELGIEISMQEAETLSTRFDVDNDGQISLNEFNRFMRSELAVDKPELMLRLRKKFALFESNGMSVVKLFTAVDKDNLGLVGFASVDSIFRFMGVNLSSFEDSLITSNYASTMDSKLCRYTDLYSDIMTTEDEFEEIETNIDTGPTLEEMLEEEKEKNMATLQKKNSALNSALKDGSSKLLSHLDWHTTANMASAFSRLAAEYASLGDFSNAEALYQHAIFLSKAAMEETDTSTSISSSLYNSGNGLNTLGGFGTAIASLDQKLAATQSKLSEVINGNDHHLERVGPSTFEATQAAKARVTENLSLSQRMDNIISSGDIPSVQSSSSSSSSSTPSSSTPSVHKSMAPMTPSSFSPSTSLRSPSTRGGKNLMQDDPFAFLATPTAAASTDHHPTVDSGLKSPTSSASSRSPPRPRSSRSNSLRNSLRNSLKSNASSEGGSSSSSSGGGGLISIGGGGGVLPRPGSARKKNTSVRGLQMHAKSSSSPNSPKSIDISDRIGLLGSSKPGREVTASMDRPPVPRAIKPAKPRSAMSLRAQKDASSPPTTPSMEIEL